MRARNSQPCVIFFDELDALCPKRSDVGDVSFFNVKNFLCVRPNIFFYGS